MGELEGFLFLFIVASPILRFLYHVASFLLRSAQRILALVALAFHVLTWVCRSSRSSSQAASEASLGWTFPERQSGHAFVSASGLRLAESAPNTAAKQDHLDFYDAVMTVCNFTDVYCGQGWSLRCDANFEPCQEVVGVRVIALGHFNSGKTWLLSRLCGTELPAGTNVHTEGVSIKVAAASGSFPVVLLDTMGANSPINNTHLPSGKAARDVAALLEELRLQEDFYRQLAFEMGQVILLVLGQMSHKDQTDLVQLAKIIQREKRRKDIVVVHNLRDWSWEQLFALGPDGCNYPERNAAIFGLTDVSLRVTLNTREELVTRHRGRLEAPAASTACDPSAVQVTHYYLTDDSLRCSVNDFVLKDLSSVISSAVPRRRPLAQELADAATVLQSRFVRFQEEEPGIVFDSSRARFVADRDMPEGSVDVKPLVGSDFSMGTDQVLYNVTAVPCFVKCIDDEADEAEVPHTDANERRRAHLLQIELPGLSPCSFAEIKKQVQAGRKGKAVWQEAYEEGGPRFVTVAFQAHLSNVPDGLREKVELTLEQIHKGRRKVELSPCLSTCEVASEGTRARFAGGERELKVTIRTDIEDYDASWKPAATYESGILSITFIGNND